MTGDIKNEDALALLLAANLAESDSGFVKTAGRVAKVDSVAVSINPLEPTIHKEPHFHARFNDEEEAVYAIESGSVLCGVLKPARHRAVLEWYSTRKDQLSAAWTVAQSGRQPLKIAASMADFQGESAVAENAPIQASSGIAKIFMMELDVFVNDVKRIAKDQGLGSQAEIDSICQELGDEIYLLAKRRCDAQPNATP